MPEYIIWTELSLEELTWNKNCIDRGELIRCKDCKYWEQSLLDVTEHICRWGGFRKGADAFCSWGMRKDE